MSSVHLIEQTEMTVMVYGVYSLTHSIIIYLFDSLACFSCRILRILPLVPGIVTFPSTAIVIVIVIVIVIGLVHAIG